MANDYKTWIDRAKSSLAISKIKLDENILYEDLCFQAQQAAEKAIKGLLIFYNVDPGLRRVWEDHLKIARRHR